MPCRHALGQGRCPWVSAHPFLVSSGRLPPRAVPWTAVGPGPQTCPTPGPPQALLLPCLVGCPLWVPLASAWAPGPHWQWPLQLGQWRQRGTQGRLAAHARAPGPLHRLVLVESIPQDLPFAAGSPSAPPLAQAWPQLLDAARESIHMASFYWSLTGPDIGVNDSSSRPVCPGPRRQLRPQAVQPGPVLGTQQVGVHLALTELWAVWGDLLGNVWVLRSWQGLGAETSLGACLTAGLALQGEALLQKLQQLLARNISLAVTTSSPAPARKSTDLQVLAAQGRHLPILGLLTERGLTCWRHGIRPRTAELPRGRLGAQKARVARAFQSALTRAGPVQGAQVPFPGAEHSAPWPL